ncbi:hypothetical protein NGB36_09675 [Streptomyces sp. RB6PN25]|uniref:Uncharacterized protein n=1 Tax=Streptomyces humicola TaxID=2953240 RepID=A0ABT1PT61_9ACTN|nr:hypothetical protein [Streptomyces humicola]MCQ4080862.1 hypothetical protein [Streptomyces humicola]
MTAPTAASLRGRKAKWAQVKANKARAAADLAAVCASHTRPWQRSDFSSGGIVAVRTHRTCTDVGVRALTAGLMHHHSSSRGALLPARRRGALIVERGALVVVTGDFFDAVPAGSGVYLLKSVVHAWDGNR